MLLQTIIEAREDYIAQRMGQKILAAYEKDNGRKPTLSKDPLVLTRILAKAGPEYIQWIARQYVNGQFKMEDIPQVKANLDAFRQLTKANALPSKDINSFKSLMDLRIALQQKSVAGGEYKGKYEKLYQALDQSTKQGHGKWLYNRGDDPIKIYIPIDEAGSVCIRKAYPDISWCTTYEDDMDAIEQQIVDEIVTDRMEEWRKENRRYYHDRDDRDYAEEGAQEEITNLAWDEIKSGEHDDLINQVKDNMHDYYLEEYGGEYYVILTPEGPFQFHFESNQFKDQNDDDINFESFIRRYPSVRKILQPIVTSKGHPHFVPPKTMKDIVRAIEASMENISRVDTRDVTLDDWANATIKHLKRADKGKGTTIPTAYTIIRQLLHALDNIGASTKDKAGVIEKVVSAYPRQIERNTLPDGILLAMKPEKADLVKGFHSWKQQRDDWAKYHVEQQQERANDQELLRRALELQRAQREQRQREGT